MEEVEKMKKMASLASNISQGHKNSTAPSNYKAPALKLFLEPSEIKEPAPKIEAPAPNLKAPPSKIEATAPKIEAPASNLKAPASKIEASASKIEVKPRAIPSFKSPVLPENHKKSSDQEMHLSQLSN